jgi:hypothetical protein
MYDRGPMRIESSTIPPFPIQAWYICESVLLLGQFLMLMSENSMNLDAPGKPRKSSNDPKPYPRCYRSDHQQAS